MQIAALDCFLNLIFPKDHLPYLRIIISFLILLFTVFTLILIFNLKRKFLTQKKIITNENEKQ